MDTVRAARVAAFPPVPDQQVGEINPVFSRNHFHQGLFDLFRCRLPGQSQATRQSHDVRIHDNTFRFAIGDAENDIGRLAADAVELDEFTERVGYFAVMCFRDVLATIADGAGLVAEEAGAANQGFEFRWRRGGEVGGGAITLEKRGGDDVYACVGALGTEDRGDEQLERVFVTQGAVGDGVRGAQAAEDGAATQQ